MYETRVSHVSREVKREQLDTTHRTPEGEVGRGRLTTLLAKLPIKLPISPSAAP